MHLFKKRHTGYRGDKSAGVVRIQEVDCRVEACGKRFPIVVGKFDFDGVVVKEPSLLGGKRGRELLGELSSDSGGKEIRNGNVGIWL